MDQPQSSQSKEPNDPSLENKLRDMILGNVTIGSPSNTRPQNRGYTGRGRQDSPSHRLSRTQGYRQHDQGPSNGNMATLSSDQAVTGFPTKSTTASHSRDQHSRAYRGQPNTRGGFQNHQSGNTGSTPLLDPSAPRAPRANTKANLYQPSQQHGPPPPPFEKFMAQCQYLDQLAEKYIPESRMTMEEMSSKGAFRDRLEDIFQRALARQYPAAPLQLRLLTFGSFSSGFATKGSDMDLAIVLTRRDGNVHATGVEPSFLRALEKALLEEGCGGRLLTRTRVPIIKVCEKPTTELYAALLEERQKWEDLPEDRKYVTSPPSSPKAQKAPPSSIKPPKAPLASPLVKDNAHDIDTSAAIIGKIGKTLSAMPPARPGEQHGGSEQGPEKQTAQPNVPHQDQKQQQARGGNASWLREKKLGPLDFPKSGVGIQCDINFSNDLALHNTRLLRCYCLCDPRVQSMVLFVKAWAKRRKINSSYSGTLSSYGYVLMVLHFLANVVSPPVVPNLQLLGSSPSGEGKSAISSESHIVQGYSIKFWGNEEEIKNLAFAGKLTSNSEPLGALLRNFFQYYANTNRCFGIGRGFQWTHEALSLRTAGGIISKQAKGWTGARTTTVGGQEVRNRYLFAIEDPFEIDHNVARTVSHRGIVAIRDEFRRAWKIINDIPSPAGADSELFAEIVEEVPRVPVESTRASDTAVDSTMGRTFNVGALSLQAM